MSFSYQRGANPAIDLPRLLVADTVDAGHVFEDEEILAVTSMEVVAVIGPAGNVQSSAGTASPRRVAATLLDSLAVDKGRLAQSIQVLDVQITTGAAAKILQDQAKALRQADDDSAGFAIVETVGWESSGLERIWKQYLRRAI